jgi:urease gamma subunit
MMTIAGVGAYSHLKHLAGVATVATTIADSVKAGKSAADILKDVLSFV